MIHGLVQCCVCGQMRNPLDRGVHYRSLDLRWMCADERACHDRAIARTTELDRRRMYRALADVWEQLERQGWRI